MTVRGSGHVFPRYSLRTSRGSLWLGDGLGIAMRASVNSSGYSHGLLSDGCK